MTSEEFKQWLEEMKYLGAARSDADCAKLLGVTANTLVSLKRIGADRRTALACRAILHRMKPYGEGQ